RGRAAWRLPGRHRRRRAVPRPDPPGGDPQQGGRAVSAAHVGRWRTPAQRGASLIVVLLLLLVVTLLGLAAMRSTLLQERMAGNMVARGQAFQSAEAALREEEAFSTGLPTPPGSGCSAGVCAMTKGGAVPAW